MTPNVLFTRDSATVRLLALVASLYSPRLLTVDLNMFSKPINWLCVLSLAVIFAPNSARAETWAGLLSDVLGYLNMDRAHLRDKLHSGEIIYAGMPEHEDLPEQLAVGGTLMLIPKPSGQEIVQKFLNAEGLTKHAGSETLAIFQEDSSAPFGSASLPTTEWAAITSPSASETFNLSAAEAQMLQKNVHQFKQAYEALLYGRFRSYYHEGLAGIRPYERPRKTDDPSLEIRTALAGFTFLDKHFPTLRESILGKPVASIDQEQFFLLHESEINNKPMHMLSRQIFEITGDWGIGADLQFYATHGLNAGFVLMGVVPYQQGSLVFALFHVFTNEVLGFGSSLKKRVGRARANELIASYFESVRQQLDASAEEN